MNEGKHIIVVDDEPEMREAMQEYLCLRNFQVSAAANGEEMNDILARNPADIVLLDLSMPGADGIQLTRDLKSRNGVGVIIVTAHGESEDRVLGLESGADDYIVKPFNFRELLARVNSVLRRTAGSGNQIVPNARVDHVQIGDWIFDHATQVLGKADGSRADLSAGELDLLTIFIDNANNPLSREELLEKSAHREWGPFDRSVDVKVARLRRKIETDPSNPKIIKTVRNLGYVLRTTPGSSG